MAVRWDNGGTVKIGTRDNDHDLMITCSSHHRALMRKAVMLELWGPGTPYRDIARALFCTRCYGPSRAELHMANYLTGHDCDRARPWGSFQGFHEVTIPWLIATLGQEGWERRNARWNSWRMFRAPY